MARQSYSDDFVKRMSAFELLNSSNPENPPCSHLCQRGEHVVITHRYNSPEHCQMIDDEIHIKRTILCKDWNCEDREIPEHKGFREVEK